MPFEFARTPLEGVVTILPKRFGDARGWFRETYRSSDFAAFGMRTDFVQDNLSCSNRGAVRGLHYQLQPHAQGKLVCVLRGRIYDVAVDIRRASAAFGHWTGHYLTAEGGEMLWIPPGCAHGFLALEDHTLVMYKCTAEYHAPSERSIRWNDPDLGIAWPTTDLEPVSLSDKDATAPGLREAEVFA